MISIIVVLVLISLRKRDQLTYKQLLHIGVYTSIVC
jgi:hypothetical protein